MLTRTQQGSLQCLSLVILSYVASGASAKAIEAPLFIDFPNRQVGKYRLIKPGPSIIDDRTDPKYYVARGHVSVPPGKVLELEIGYEGGMHPEFLRTVPKSLIRNLTCRNMEIGNQCVEALTCQSEIRYLDISDTDITDDVAPTLLKFPKLEQISLSRNQVGAKTFEAVATMKGLRILSMSCCTVPEETISKFGNLVELRKLDLTGCRISDKNLQAFEKLTNLNELILGRSSVTDSGITSLLKLKNLARLNLSDSKVTLRGLMRLKALPKLGHLCIRMTNMPAADKEVLSKAMPQVRIEEGTKARDWDNEMFAPLR